MVLYKESIMQDLTWGHVTKRSLATDETFEPTKRAKKNSKKDDSSPFGLNNIEGFLSPRSRGEAYTFSRENHVYFYTHIMKDTIVGLQQEVRAVLDNLEACALKARKMNFKVTYPPIVLHLFSPGGSIFAAFTFIDFMIQLKKENKEVSFHSIIEGGSASAATLLSVTADKRFITENGYMLIHQLSSVAFGKYYEIKDDMFNLDSLMERIFNIYRIHTKITESELQEFLKHDIYWDAKTCLKHGLVDKIITNVKDISTTKKSLDNDDDGDNEGNKGGKGKETNTGKSKKSTKKGKRK